MFSRADNLVEIVRNINSVKELKTLKEFLLDETNVLLLRDSQVYLALKEIPIQIGRILKENPSKLINEILEVLIWEKFL